MPFSLFLFVYKFICIIFQSPCISDHISYLFFSVWLPSLSMIISLYMTLWSSSLYEWAVIFSRETRKRRLRDKVIYTKSHMYGRAWNSIQVVWLNICKTWLSAFSEIFQIRDFKSMLHFKVISYHIQRPFSPDSCNTSWLSWKPVNWLESANKNLLYRGSLPKHISSCWGRLPVVPISKKVSFLCVGKLMGALSNYLKNAIAASRQ